MSEKSCLHCGATAKKYKYQAVFDPLGLEIGLAELLLKHFECEIKKNDKKQQFLCEVCVNTLINLLDIDELERQRRAEQEKKAAHAAKVIGPKTQPKKLLNQSVIAPAAAVAVAVKTEPPPKTQSISKVIAVPTVKTKSPAKPIVVPVAKIKAEKSRSSVPTKITDAHPKLSPGTSNRTPRNSSVRAQTQISALLRNILSDDEKDDDDEEDEISSGKATKTLSDRKIISGTEIPYDEIDADIEYNTNEECDEEYIEEDEEEEEEPLPRKAKSTRIKSRSSQQETVKDNDRKDDSIVPLNLIPIKDVDDVKDLYKYLENVIRTEFENLTFKWSTECQFCSQKCSTFEELLDHMLTLHKGSQNRCKCPFKNCTTVLSGRKLLAVHLVLAHAPVNNIPIYGSCPECKLTFSNILHYNKHSCAHFFKKRRGVRLFCESCSMEFPSWKRYIFHKQFHLEKHRPRACFICNTFEMNLDELFHHLYYAHEREGTLFCDMCDRYFRNVTVYEEHKSSHANVGTFICRICKETCETRSRLHSHMRMCHGDIFQCQVCSREFSSEKSLNSHMNSHLIIEEDMHVCTKCGVVSDVYENLRYHTLNKEMDCGNAEVETMTLRSVFSCEFCSLHFKSREQLIAHRESGIHSDGLYQCLPCTKNFPSMKLYRNHMQQFQQRQTDTKHRKLDISQYFVCNYSNCDEVYMNWNSMYAHKRRIHLTAAGEESSTSINTTSTATSSSTGSTNFTCQFCQKVCKTKMSLSVHVARAHNNNNLSCPLCKSCYKDADALYKHHEYWHEPMTCEECFKVVKNRRNYDTHMKVVHSNTKRFMCSTCNKGFYFKSERDAHEKLHSQSFSCEFCNFKTKHKQSLDIHIQGSHYKSFPFECNVCKKRFSRKQSYTFHIRHVHQKAKNQTYKCSKFIADGCNRTCFSMHQLSTHVRKKHNTSILCLDDFDETDAQADDLAEDSTLPAKRLCYKINDTDIEFVGADAEDSNASFGDVQEITQIEFEIADDENE